MSCKDNSKLSLVGEMKFNLEDSLRESKEKEKELLIYFNGFGCVNCRYLEEDILKDTKIARLINEHYKLVVLYVDDKTKIENKEGRTDFKGKRIKTNGHLNVNYQIVMTQTGTQPLFVVVDENGLVQRQINFTKDKKKFEAFLKNNLF